MHDIKKDHEIIGGIYERKILNDLIKKVNIVYEMDNLDNNVLYHYGCYVNVLAGVNKGLKKKDIIEKYEALPIKRRDDILITASEMCETLSRTPGSFIGKLYSIMEDKIINGELINDNKILKEFIKENDYE